MRTPLCDQRAEKEELHASIDGRAMHAAKSK
jgi:hypothetical protein